MHRPAKKSICMFTLVGVFSVLQFMVGITHSNAQSAADIDKEVSDLENGANQLIRKGQIENQNRVSKLSCQQLIAEAHQFTKNGDYWASQGTRAGNASAEGSYSASEQRYQEYNRRCR